MRAPHEPQQSIDQHVAAKLQTYASTVYTPLCQTTAYTLVYMLLCQPCIQLSTFAFKGLRKSLYYLLGHKENSEKLTFSFSVVPNIYWKKNE